MGQLKENLTILLAKNQISSLKSNIFSLSIPKQIAYRCGITFQLSAKEGELPQILAEKLYKSYQKQPNRDFHLIIQSDGYLDFSPYPTTLMTWLVKFPTHWQYIRENYTKIVDYQSYKKFNAFFCQYAYARCCSLQRLVTQEQAKLNNNIPWLFYLENSHSLETQEWELLQRLIFICDRINTASDKEVLKLLMALSSSFLSFERSCQILGEVNKKTPQVAQVRIELINYITIILQSLLTDWLQLEAPTHL